MKITRVETTVTETPVEHVFRRREGLPGSGTVNVVARVTIETDEGLTGEVGLTAVQHQQPGDEGALIESPPMEAIVRGFQRERQHQTAA